VAAMHGSNEQGEYCIIIMYCSAEELNNINKVMNKEIGDSRITNTETTELHIAYQMNTDTISSVLSPSTRPISVGRILEWAGTC